MTTVETTMFAGAMDRPRVKRRFPRPMWAGLALSAALTAGVVWFGLHPGERALRLPISRITVSSVTTAPFRDFIPVRGRVEPLASVVLDAVQGGRVEEVLAEAGQKVVAGQPLIRLSEPSLELEAIARETQIIEQINNQRSLELNFEQTRSSDAKAVADADYNITRLERQVARRRPLADKGFASQEQLDQSADELAYQQGLRKLAVDALQRDAAVIARGKDLLQRTASRLDANLAAAKSQLDALIVRAPTDGLLTGLDAHVGEEKTRGQHLGEIDREGGFKATIQVDEFHLARVKPGQRVAATIDGSTSALVVAKVYPQVKDGLFEVDLAFDGAPPAGLRRGQAVQGKLELGGDAPAALLPAGPFLEASGGAWAFVLDRDGTSAARRSVKLGRRNADWVEVLSGLEPGDRVVTSDYAGLDRIDRLDLSN
jgi:HlyD family secretion protein